MVIELSRAGYSLNRALFGKNVGPLIRAGVRQLAALFVVFKGGSSSGGPGVCPRKILEILVCCR